jgi:hypothetical protein
VFRVPRNPESLHRYFSQHLLQYLLRYATRV